jgi:hypothetical protein
MGQAGSEQICGSPILLIAQPCAFVATLRDEALKAQRMAIHRFEAIGVAAGAALYPVPRTKLRR